MPVPYVSPRKQTANFKAKESKSKNCSIFAVIICLQGSDQIEKIPSGNRIKLIQWYLKLGGSNPLRSNALISKLLKGCNKQLKQNCIHPWWQPLRGTKAKDKRHAALFRGSQQTFGESGGNQGGIRAAGGNGLSVLCALRVQTQSQTKTKQRRLTSGAIV